MTECFECHHTPSAHRDFGVKAYMNALRQNGLISVEADEFLFEGDVQDAALPTLDTQRESSRLLHQQEEIERLRRKQEALRQSQRSSSTRLLDELLPIRSSPQPRWHGVRESNSPRERGPDGAPRWHWLFRRLPLPMFDWWQMRHLDEGVGDDDADADLAKMRISIDQALAGSS